MSLSVDISERCIGQDMHTLEAEDHPRSPSSSSSCSGTGSESRGSQNDLYVPMHRRTATGTSRTSTNRTSVASSSKENMKSLPSRHGQRFDTKPSPSLYTREELLALAPPSLVQAALHPVVTPALVGKFPSILRVKGDGVAKALEMSRTPVNRHKFYSLPPVPVPFPIPVQNTGFQRARKLHPQVASTVSPYNALHLHNMFWNQDNHQAPYGFLHFSQPSVEFSLPPVRPKPTLRPADDMHPTSAEQPLLRKTQSEGIGPDPVVALEVAHADKAGASSAETAMPLVPAMNQAESTPAQERRRRRQRDRRRRQRAKQAITASGGNDVHGIDDGKEGSTSVSNALPEPSSNAPTSPRMRSSSAPLRQRNPSNVPQRQRHPTNAAGFDKQARQRQLSSAFGFAKHRRSASGKVQGQSSASNAAQASIPALAHVQQERKPVLKAAQAQQESEAGHRFRFARTGEPVSWRAKRPQVAQANAA